MRHRCKAYGEKKASPTQVGVFDQSGKFIRKYDLPTADSELDWVKGKVPVAYRPAEEGDDLTNFATHHIKWETLGNKETPVHLIREFEEEIKGKKVVVTKYAAAVPSEYDGLQPGDTVIMIMGGLGKYMASAVCKRVKFEQLDAHVYRINPKTVHDVREQNNLTKKEKDHDIFLLAKLFIERRDQFFEFKPADLASIYVREMYNLRKESMEDRMKCEQRIHARAEGKVFCSPEGYFPDGLLANAIKEQKANNTIRQKFLEDEESFYKELGKVVKLHPVSKLFAEIPGCGPRVTAALIAFIGDINRFPTEQQFLTFCGVVSRDGRLPVKTRGQKMNWNPEVRQALFMYHDQVNRHAEWEWGKKFLEIKAEYRQKYPEPVPNTKGNGRGYKENYTDGHIHKMARWKFLNRFCAWLYKEWKAVVNG